MSHFKYLWLPVALTAVPFFSIQKLFAEEDAEQVTRAAFTLESPNSHIQLSVMATDNTNYLMTTYADASDAHYIKKREAYKITTRTINSGDSIDINMAPGGGQTITLKQVQSI